jgi:hypothetical protein
MALDRDQVGLLFNIDVNAMDARQQIELFQGVVEGMTAEVRDQFGRMNTQIAATTRETGKLAQSFGDAASNQLRGFLGQFGLIGDAAGDMIPALSGTSAAIVGLTGVTVAAGAALAATAVKAMDYTGKIDDLAQVTNLTTETIQSLQLAATLSGQSFEDVSQTAIIFQKRIEEAKKGNAELMATFKALGVDLNGPVDQAFRQTLERLNDLEDGSLKTSVSLDLFGKSGSKLLPVMDQVGGSFDGLISRARELGIVLSEEDIAKSNQFADQLDILSLKMKGLANDVGVGLINMLNDLGDAFVEAFDPAAAERMQATLNEMQNKARQEGTIDPALRARLEGIDTGANAPNALQLALEEARRKPAAGRTGGAGRTGREAKPPELDEEKLRRQYQAYRAALLAEEQKVNEEREKLRIQGIEGEEAKLRDAVVQMETRLADLRIQAQAAALERSDRAGILAQTVANLEAEKALTMQAIEEIETARVQAMMRFVEAAKEQTQKRLEDEKAKELALLQNFQAIREAIRRGLEQTYVDVGFSPQAAAAIVAQQDLLGRQLTMWEQVQVGATSLAQVIQQTMPSMAATMVNTSMAVSDALANMVSAFATGRGTMRQVVGAFLDAALAPLRDYLLTKSKAHFALGLADLAMQNYAGAAKNFLAATALAGAAGLIKAGTSAIGGGGMGAAAPIAPSSGGQFLAQDRGAGGTMIREQGGRRSSEPQVIIIRAETEPGVMVSKVIQDYKSNGEMRSTLRRDLLGEF